MSNSNGAYTFFLFKIIS